MRLLPTFKSMTSPLFCAFLSSALTCLYPRILSQADTHLHCIDIETRSLHHQITRFSLPSARRLAIGACVQHLISPRRRHHDVRVPGCTLALCTAAAHTFCATSVAERDHASSRKDDCWSSQASRRRFVIFDEPCPTLR